jgi:hypothetical protein
VDVYLGYLNNLGLAIPPAVIPPGAIDPSLFREQLLSRDDFPIPFDPDTLGNTTLISSGPSNTPHDTGVIRFVNNGFFAVDIHLDELSVETELFSFSPWADLRVKTVTLGVQKNLVLAETENFNFDTSDAGRNIAPIVRGRISTGYTEDLPFNITDSARVLLGKGTPPHEINGPPETTGYHRVATLRPQLPANTPLLAITESSGPCDEYTLTNFGNIEGSFSVSGTFTLKDSSAQEAAIVTRDPPDGRIPAGKTGTFVFEPPTNGTADSLVFHLMLTERVGGFVITIDEPHSLTSCMPIP